MVDAASFALFCSPAINLFPKEKIAVDVNRRRFEHHLVPERTQPMDFEVYRVNAVKGPGTSGKQFLPLYSPKFSRAEGGQNLACFTVRREPRRVSSRIENDQTRSEYLGSEVFLTLADSGAPPHNANLNRVFVDTLCTNRGSPLLLGNTDFEPPRTGAPVESVSTIVGPTPPKPSLATIMQRDPTGSTGSAWRLASHLSLGYLPMQDRDDPNAGVGAVREWLRLYGDQADPALQRQIDGVVGVSFRPIVRPITPRQRDAMCRSNDDSASIPYWLTACARGLEITVTCDETHFVGYGLFLFGAVLEQVFARYVSINSLTETVLKTTKGVEVMRWPARDGTKVVL
jgi:type VI secretion system protein ImpG